MASLICGQPAEARTGGQGKDRKVARRSGNVGKKRPALKKSSTRAPRQTRKSRGSQARNQSSASARSTKSSNQSKTAAAGKSAPRSARVKEAVKLGLITERQAQRINNPKQLEDIVHIVETGASFGIGRDKVGRLVDQYVKNPGAEGIVDETLREIVEEGLGLPDSASEAGLSAEEMVEFAGDVHTIGGADLLGNTKVWDAVKAGGANGGMINVHQDLFGLPDEAYQSGNIRDVFEGQGEAATLGADASNPQYWKDLSKVNAGEMTSDDFVNQYGNTANAGSGNNSAPEHSTTVPGSTNQKPEPAVEDNPEPETPGTDGPGSQNPSEPAPETPATGDNTPPADEQPKQTPPAQEEPVETPTQTTPENTAPRNPVNDSPPPSEAMPSNPVTEKTVVSREARFNIGGATWVTTRYSDGTFKAELIDNATGEVLRTGAEGDVQVIDHNSATDPFADDDGSGEDNGGHANTDNNDDSQNDDEQNNSNDDEEKNNSEDEEEDDAEEEQDSDEDESSSDEESDDTEDEAPPEESDGDAEAEDDGEEAAESTPVDPNEPSEEQKKAMREAMLNDPVFQETVIGTRIYDHEKGSVDTNPNPMGETLPAVEMDPKAARDFQIIVTGQPANPNDTTIDITPEMIEAVLKNKAPGAGLIDYGPDHFENQEQPGMNPGMQNETGRGTMEGEAAPPPPSNNNDDDDDDDADDAEE